MGRVVTSDKMEILIAVTAFRIIVELHFAAYNAAIKTMANGRIAGIYAAVIAQRKCLKYSKNKQCFLFCFINTEDSHSLVNGSQAFFL